MRTKLRLFKYSRGLVNWFAPSLTSIHSAMGLRRLDEHDLDQIAIDSYASKVGSGFDSEEHNQQGLFPGEDTALR